MELKNFIGTPGYHLFDSPPLIFDENQREEQYDE